MSVSSLRGTLVLLLVVVALAAMLLWARPWQPAVASVSTGEVSCSWGGGQAFVSVPVRVDGRGDVPVSVRGFVHRVREPRSMPYLSTVELELPAGTKQVVEVEVPLSRAEWRDGRAACSGAVTVGEDPPVLP